MLAPGKEEVIQLGEDLVAWATEETEEKRTAWSFWYALKHGMIQSHWKSLKKLPEFRPYYEIARSALASKIHNDTLEKGMAHRYIRLYDRDLAANEDEDAIFNNDLKKAVAEATPPNDLLVEQQNKIMELQAKIDELSHKSQAESKLP